MIELDENQQILLLSENEISSKKELKYLSKMNITKLIKEAIDKNKIENVFKNLDLCDSKIKSTKSTFDLIYIYLEEKIRKNELIF